MNTEWTYECACLDEGCKWKAVFTDRASWEAGAAAKHAKIFNHRVKTVSVKIIDPAGGEEKPAVPTAKDKYIGQCRDCGRYLGVGAHRMFNAAVKSHENRTGHVVNVTANPKWRPKKRGAED